MDRYEPGDKVRTTCIIERPLAYDNLQNFGHFASSEAIVSSIAEGTSGVVVQHINNELIVSFSEPGVVGRSIDPSMVQLINED